MHQTRSFPCIHPALARRGISQIHDHQHTQRLVHIPSSLFWYLRCTERPVAYASRALNTAKQNYSQIDREGLALTFAVKKFHKYLAGCHFTLVTDHKPLLGLFGEGKSIPEHASARVQRSAITLSAYSYKLQHRPGRENSADALSRLASTLHPRRGR